MDEDSSGQQPPEAGGLPTNPSHAGTQGLIYSNAKSRDIQLSSPPITIPADANQPSLEQQAGQSTRQPVEPEPRTPTGLSISKKANKSILHRTRPEASPFFGRPVIPGRSSSSGPSREDSRGSCTPATSPLSPPEGTVTTLGRESRAVSSSAVIEERPRILPQPRSASDSQNSKFTPKKIVRPDDWWQKGKPPVDQAPTLPDKSPLRALLSNLPSRPPPIRPQKHFAKGSELEDLLEQEVLRLELSPPPLHIGKDQIESPTSLKTGDTPQKTLAPPEAQARLEEANEISILAQEAILRKVISQESLTEATKPDLAEKVEEAEDSYKRRHRKMTLNILEGSPFPPEYKKVAELEFPFRSETDTVGIKMDSLHPNSAAALTAHRREAIRLAKSQERAVAERCKRSDQETPGYAFDELIGKGSFGRVYKGLVHPQHQDFAF